MDYLEFCVVIMPFTIICVMGYIFFLAFVDLRYTFTTFNNPEKKGNLKFFSNELLIGLMFLFLGFAYPFVFNFKTSDPLILGQLYFHLWISLSFHFPSWALYVFFANKNDIKKNRHYTYEEFKEITRTSHSSDLKAESQRKILHLISSGIVIGFYIVGKLFEVTGFIPSILPWNSNLFSSFMQINVGIHFVFAMSIGDNLRLQKFEKLGQVGRDWMKNSVRPEEFDTYTGAQIMGLALIPFFFGSQALLISVVLIGALSDAMASIIGKRFGKIREFTSKSKKTLEGYIAGFITTYLILIIVHTFAPFPNANWLVVNLMALSAAIAFLLVDIYARMITDNFLNPIVCGTIITLISFIIP
jgi:dolichol kinase